MNGVDRIVSFALRLEEKPARLYKKSGDASRVPFGLFDKMQRVFRMSSIV